MIGFSQWGTATAEITLGKKDGFRSIRPDDYETLLNDARSTHVILHDTTHKRAYQTNAEDLILHILLHRRSVDPPTTSITKVDDLQFANANRQTLSARTAMLSNAEKIYAVRTALSSSKYSVNSFKHEVKLLYSTLDGLWAQANAGTGKSVKLGLDLGQAVTGYEYMDVMKNVKEIVPKSVDLRRSCGRWNEYAKDIQAIVLFGANFGDVFKPAGSNMCSDFMSLPRDECYLAVRVETLQHLFDRQGSLEDQNKLTDSGLTLHGSKDLFKPCVVGRHVEGQQCSSQYVVRLVRQSVMRKTHCPLPLEQYGAVIIGGIRDGFFPKALRREQEGQTPPRTRRQERQAAYRARYKDDLSTDPCMIPYSSPGLSEDLTLEPIDLSNSLKVNPAPSSNTPKSGNSLSSVNSSRHWSGFSSVDGVSSYTSVSSSSAPRTWSSVVASKVSSP